MPKIILYEHTNFQGEKLELTSTTLNVLGFNDKASSIVVESGEWRVYEHSNCAGTNHLLQPGSYATWHDWGGNNDNISSVSLVKPSKITIYQDANFAGRSLTFTSGEPNLVEQGFNDTVSSMKVELGEWLIYKDVNYSGSLHFVGVGDYPTWHSWGGSNDTISSLKPV